MGGVSIFEDTPPKFNIDPEQWWLEDYFPIGKVTFQGLYMLTFWGVRKKPSYVCCDFWTS